MNYAALQPIHIQLSEMEKIVREYPMVEECGVYHKRHFPLGEKYKFQKSNQSSQWVIGRKARSLDF
jgi:hypothetical protein